jgi:hypothetical protein
VHYDGWYEERFEQVLGALGYGALEFRQDEWKGTYNVTVTARKQEPFAERDAQLDAAERLLRDALVDDTISERRLLEVWLADLRR